MQSYKCLRQKPDSSVSIDPGSQKKKNSVIAPRVHTRVWWVHNIVSIHDIEVTWGQQGPVLYNIEANDKVCVHLYARAGYEMRFGGVGSEISNWSDRQRELRTLFFFPDDHRKREPRSDRSDVPAFRYGENEFSYEGHQERPDLRDTSINCMSVHNLDS